MTQVNALLSRNRVGMRCVLLTDDSDRRRNTNAPILRKGHCVGWKPARDERLGNPAWSRFYGPRASSQHSAPLPALAPSTRASVGSQGEVSPEAGPKPKCFMTERVGMSGRQCLNTTTERLALSGGRGFRGHEHRAGYR